MGKPIAMKRAGQIALLLLAICLLAMPVLASSTTLTISVPGSITVAVELHGQGTITFGDVVCCKTDILSIPRNQSIAVSTVPDKGWELKSATIDGVDYTDTLRRGEITLEGRAEDFSADIIFRRSSDNPQTGDAGMLPWLSLMAMATVGLAWIQRKKYILL